MTREKLTEAPKAATSPDWHGHSLSQTCCVRRRGPAPPTSSPYAYAERSSVVGQKSSPTQHALGAVQAGSPAGQRREWEQVDVL